MNRLSSVIPRQMSVRKAAYRLYRSKSAGAPVVDEKGRCVGMLLVRDILRWIQAGCPEAVVDPGNACPYQIRGRLLTGDAAVICTLADGSCPFQEVQPTTAGRHTEVCMRQENEASPFGALPKYMTTDRVTVGPETRLPDLMHRMFATHTDRLVVVDDQKRPVGAVSATDILAAIANGDDFEQDEPGDAHEDAPSWTV
jgi:CBS domain-containing protein